MRRLAVRLEYDGTDFCGWQLQAEGRTVQAALEEALRRTVGTEERLVVHGAGRTDAGVHAEGQVAHCDAPWPHGAPKLVCALNYWLPADVAVLEAAEVPPAFHARFSAAGKLYRYRVLSSAVRRPLRERCCVRVEPALDLGVMRRCAEQVVGERDFAGFTSSGSAARDAVRTMSRSEWVRRDDELHYLIRGEGFTYHMVRSLVGTMLEAGRGKMDAEEFGRLLETGDRCRAGPTAPARGLTLVRVYYPEGESPFADA